MCQLAAYVGSRDAAPILLESLRLQEGYLGAHATGLATVHRRKIHMVKDNGPVDEVTKKTKIASLRGSTGIAHSRHSAAVLKDSRCNRSQNAHPWLTEDGSAAVMHNGIINNYEEHWRKLEKSHVFASLVNELNYITDSEVAVHMLSDRVKEDAAFAEALRSTANSLTGMVLLGAVNAGEPHTIYITNWNQPCYLGVGDGESMFASSRVGFSHLKDAFNVFRAPSNSLIKLTPGEAEIKKLDTGRSFPNLTLDISVFEDHVKRLLGEMGELDSYDLLIPLLRRGYDEAYGIEPDTWRTLVMLGYGDANDLFEPLEQLSEWGRIKRSVKHKVEGGVTVPRVMWSL
jgi:glucosamine 6-phosphate synthetase-like amidotransferase/phosphosugar isomerase protein